MKDLWAGGPRRGGVPPPSSGEARPVAREEGRHGTVLVVDDDTSILDTVSSILSGEGYDVTPDAGLVPPFKNLSLRLNVGEVGVVRTDFGIHIIQRVQ